MADTEYLKNREILEKKRLDPSYKEEGSLDLVKKKFEEAKIKDRLNEVKGKIEQVINKQDVFNAIEKASNGVKEMSDRTIDSIGKFIGVKNTEIDNAGDQSEDEVKTEENNAQRELNGIKKETEKQEKRENIIGALNLTLKILKDIKKKTPEQELVIKSIEDAVANSLNKNNDDLLVEFDGYSKKEGVPVDQLITEAHKILNKQKNKKLNEDQEKQLLDKENNLKVLENNSEFYIKRHFGKNSFDELTTEEKDLYNKRVGHEAYFIASRSNFNGDANQEAEKAMAGRRELMFDKIDAEKKKKQEQSFNQFVASLNIDSFNWDNLEKLRDEFKKCFSEEVAGREDEVDKLFNIFIERIERHIRAQVREKERKSKKPSSQDSGVLDYAKEEFWKSARGVVSGFQFAGVSSLINKGVVMLASKTVAEIALPATIVGRALTGAGVATFNHFFKSGFDKVNNFLGENKLEEFIKEKEVGDSDFEKLRQIVKSDLEAIVSFAEDKENKFEKLRSIAEQISDKNKKKNILSLINSAQNNIAEEKRQKLADKALKEKGGMREFIDLIYQNQIKEINSQNLSDQEKKILVDGLGLEIEKELNILIGDNIIRSKEKVSQHYGEVMWRGFKSGVVAGALSSTSVGAIYVAVQRLQGTFSAEMNKKIQEKEKSTNRITFNSIIKNLELKDKMDDQAVRKAINLARAQMKNSNIDNVDRVKIEQEINKLIIEHTKKGVSGKLLQDVNVSKKIIDQIEKNIQEIEDKEEDIKLAEKSKRGMGNQFKVFFKDLSLTEQSKVFGKTLVSAGIGAVAGLVGSGAFNRAFGEEFDNEIKPGGGNIIIGENPLDSDQAEEGVLAPPVVLTGNTQNAVYSTTEVWDPNNIGDSLKGAYSDKTSSHLSNYGAISSDNSGDFGHTESPSIYHDSNIHHDSKIHSPESGKSGASEHQDIRGVDHEFKIELGKDGVPAQLERVFGMIAVDHMDIKGEFAEKQAAESLNMAQNLIRLSEGHNVAGINHHDFEAVAHISKDAHGHQVLEIRNHARFNDLVEKLENHADDLWDKRALQKGALAYVDDIKHGTWENIVHAKDMDKVGSVETGISGHDNIHVADFDHSQSIEDAEHYLEQAITKQTATVVEPAKNEASITSIASEAPATVIDSDSTSSENTAKSEDVNAKLADSISQDIIKDNKGNINSEEVDYYVKNWVSKNLLPGQISSADDQLAIKKVIESDYKNYLHNVDENIAKSNDSIKHFYSEQNLLNKWDLLKTKEASVIEGVKDLTSDVFGEKIPELYSVEKASRSLMQNYLQYLSKESGLESQVGEKVPDFIDRSIKQIIMDNQITVLDQVQKSVPTIEEYQGEMINNNIKEILPPENTVGHEGKLVEESNIIDKKNEEHQAEESIKHQEELSDNNLVITEKILEHGGEFGFDTPQSRAVTVNTDSGEVKLVFSYNSNHDVTDVVVVNNKIPQSTLSGGVSKGLVALIASREVFIKEDPEHFKGEIDFLQRRIALIENTAKNRKP